MRGDFYKQLTSNLETARAEGLFKEERIITSAQQADQVDSLLESNEENDSNIKVLSKNMQRTYQKMGLIKYDRCV